MRIHSPVLKLSGLYRGHGGRCLDLGAPHLSPLSSGPRVKHVEPLKLVTPPWARFSFLHSQNVVFIKVNLVGIAFRIDSFNLNKAGILVNLASHYSSSGGQSLLHQQIRWVTWCWPMARPWCRRAPATLSRICRACIFSRCSMPTAGRPRSAGT